MTELMCFQETARSIKTAHEKRACVSRASLKRQGGNSFRESQGEKLICFPFMLYFIVIISFVIDSLY